MTTKDIAIILAKRDPEKYKYIIVRAANNGYHDFKHDNIPGHPEYGDTICPKLTLVDHLAEFPELSDVRNQVVNGDFDESPDEVDDINIRVMLLNECEGPEDDFLFTMLGLAVPSAEERANHKTKAGLN